MFINSDENDIVTVYSDGKKFRNGVLVKGREFSEVMTEALTMDYGSEKIVDQEVQQIKPTLKELAQSAASSVITLIKDGVDVVTGEERARRLLVCAGCYHLNEQSRCLHVRMADGTIENGCGCYMPVKACLKAMKCPTGRW